MKPNTVLSNTLKLGLLGEKVNDCNIVLMKANICIVAISKSCQQAINPVRVKITCSFFAYIC